MSEGFISSQVKVTVGGATVFVLDVDKFIKL
ncbi:MAG: cyclic-di-AMP receptor [Clostridia bacterium]|nr:cyclic-di-AMP receptor [Clostridia bacterium]